MLCMWVLNSCVTVREQVESNLFASTHVCFSRGRLSVYSCMWRASFDSYGDDDLLQSNAVRHMFFCIKTTNHADASAVLMYYVHLLQLQKKTVFASYALPSLGLCGICHCWKSTLQSSLQLQKSVRCITLTCTTLYGPFGNGKPWKSM